MASDPSIPSGPETRHSRIAFPAVDVIPPATAHGGRLPAALTSLVGRERDVAEISGVGAVRLLVERAREIPRTRRFHRGFTLGAVEWMRRAAIGDGAASGRHRNPMSLVTALADQSLVQRLAEPFDPPRFRLLEPIRAYAAAALGREGAEWIRPGERRPGARIVDGIAAASGGTGRPGFDCLDADRRGLPRER